MIGRVVAMAVGLAAAAALAAPAPLAVSSTETASRFAISRARTGATVQTSASGAEMIQLTFVAELTSDSGPDVSDDVVVTWQEVGGVEPEPFRVLIPAGCFRDLRGRGFYVDDFRSCGVQLSVASSARGFAVLEIVDFRARLLHLDGTSWFDIVTSVIPPDPVVPPDPIVPPTAAGAFLGLVGGAAVEIAIGSESSAAPPLRIVTVSGIDPTPF